MRAPDLFDRRQFLKASGIAFAAALTPRALSAMERADALFASAYRDPAGRFGIATLTESGLVLDRTLLPDRAHGLAYHPQTGRLAAFARRPGTYVMILDRTGKEETVVVTAPEGRHFYGHGCFSRDGNILFACENDFDAGRGVIGLYDGRERYRRIGEFPSYGIGPHDLALSDDGQHLVVANGGIATHPDFGRTKLNIDCMKPSLALIAAADGRLLESHDLPPALSRLSTRHIDIDAGGRIWFACQYEGSRDDCPPLAGWFAKGEDIRFLSLPQETTQALALYVGAVAVNRHEGILGLTSPKGGVSVTIDTATGEVLSTETVKDAAGIAPAPNGFAVSSYDGRFRGASGDLTWDQHIAALSTHHL